MRIPQRSPAPVTSPTPDSTRVFSLKEAHLLATDPDFKVTTSHAPKLGVDALEQARALLELPTLSNKAIVELTRIARVQLLWILGASAPQFQQLARTLSDEKLSRVDQEDDRFAEQPLREWLTALFEGMGAVMEPELYLNLRQQAAKLVATKEHRCEAGKKIFSLLFEALALKWEERATKEINATRPKYAQAAAQMELEYYSHTPPERFLQGHTARWVGLAVTNPQARGLTNGAFADSRAVHRLQSALLCEVVTYPKTIAPEMLPETLELDVEHLLRLQNRFQHLVQALCITDFYAATTKISNDKKSEIVRQALWSLNAGDETYGLPLEPKQLQQLKSLVSHAQNSVGKLHRERLQQLLLKGLNATGLEKTTVEKWHYEGVLGELEQIRQHLLSILAVHFPVFVGTYYSLMESHLEGTVWKSILSRDGNDYRDWLNQEEQQKAEEIQRQYKEALHSITALAAQDQSHIIEATFQKCLFGYANWASLYSLLTVKGQADFNSIANKLSLIVTATNELRIQIQMRRVTDCKRDMSRRPPSHLKTGFLLG